MATIRNYAVLGVAAIAVAACSTEHVSAAATTSSAVSSPAPASSSATAAGAVSLPDQLLGQDKDTSADAAQVVSMLDREYASSLTAALSGPLKTAVYGDEQNGFFIVLAAKSQRQIASPDNTVDVMKNDWVSSGVTDARVFPAGPNGAAVACRPAQQDIVCMWADHVGIGLTLFSQGFASSLNDGASKTAQIRSAVVH